MPKLDCYQERRRGDRVEVRGDDRAQYGSVAKVLARIKAAGIPVTLVTEPVAPTQSIGQARRAMGRSTFISAALHAAILLFALVAFSSAKVDRTPLAIPIDLAAAPSDITKLKAGSADAKDDAALAGKPKEPKPQAVKEATPKPPTRPRRLPMPARKPKERHAQA